MTLGDTAAAVGKGSAGAAGTVAMTVSSTLEAKLRERGSSSAPADAAEKVLAVQPREEVAIDMFHHAVYALATGLAFAALQRSSS